MSVMEEFRAKVMAGEIAEALSLAMSEAVELKVTTWVASSDYDSSSLSKSQPGYRWRTRLDIVNGKVENEIGSELLDNPGYRELQRLHLEQVQQGRKVLIANLETLQAMFAIFNDTLNTIPSEIPQLPSTE